MEEVPSLLSLPEPLLAKIVWHLDTRSAGALALACCSLSSSARIDDYWRHQCVRLGWG